MKTLTEMIDVIYGDKPYVLRQHIQKEVLSNVSYASKGFLWEDILEKFMPHTDRCPPGTAHMDFTDGSDAKLAVFHPRKDPKSGMIIRYEASISGIRTKEGPLRVCLVTKSLSNGVDTLDYLLIPNQSLKPYLTGSNALKVSKSPRGGLTGNWAKYQVKFDEVIKPI